MDEKTKKELLTLLEKATMEGFEGGVDATIEAVMVLLGTIGFYVDEADIKQMMSDMKKTILEEVEIKINLNVV